jgi:hypothetical protein
MAGLNENDIVEVTMIGSLFGQTIRNVFHYRVLTASSAITYVQAAFHIAQNFDAGPDSPGLPILAASAPQYVWDKTRVQRISPTRDVYVESTVALPGTNEVATTSNVSSVITKRGGLGNRHNIGSVHIAAPPTAAQVAGKWNAAYMLKLEAVAGNMTKLLKWALDGLELRMCIYNRKVAIESKLVEFTQPQDTVRVMRRRTLRVGE